MIGDDDMPSPGFPELPDETAGGSVTFDFDGHFRGAELHAQVPGAADGSDPARWEFEPHSEGGHDPAAAPWMPDITHPGEPAIDPLDITHAPVPEGWDRDNLGILHPHLDGLGGGGAPDFQLEMPQLEMPQHENPYAPHLDVPQLHLDTGE